jgi:hypothetical protein
MNYFVVFPQLHCILWFELYEAALNHAVEFEGDVYSIWGMMQALERSRLVGQNPL